MAYSDIKDPSAHFQTKVYTGTNANQSITNDGNSDLQPDWIFASYRTLPPYTNHRVIIDSSRGRAKILESDTNAAEATTTNAAYDLVSFDTDGFTVGPVNSTSSLNAGNTPTVAWQWKANGGTTSSNTDGSITSTVQANTTAGFSIVSYTGNATNNATVGHGLGAALSVLIIKDLTDGSVWGVWHKDLTNAGYRLTLSTDGAQTTDSGFMGGGNLTLPTSSVFSLGQGGGGNGNNAYIAYCFAEKQGYSKFDKYVGNANSNGPFVYTGFKPAFVMMKRKDSTGGWIIYDNKRGYNGNNYELFAHSSEVEHTATSYFEADILSNGFKIRNTDAGQNAHANYYIYMAFAENPFVAGGVPTTAR